MAEYDLLLAEDIDCHDIYSFISNFLNKGRTLFLTATQSLNRLRKLNNIFDKLDDTNEFCTYSELTEKVYKNIRKGVSFISVADQKFILNQTIKSLFKGERQLAIYKIRNDLFNLFEYLIEQEIDSVDEKIIETIGKDFTVTERDIFVIYNQYYRNLFDIKNGKKVFEIDINEKYRGRSTKLLKEVFVSTLFQEIENYDTIIFDGFLFFNDEQTLILNRAISDNKNIVFIAKSMKADKEKFLFNNLFLPLEKELNIKLRTFNFTSSNVGKSNAISYTKNNYLNFFSKPKMDIENGFKFIEPFTSRDRELNYIVNCISKYIEKHGNNDRNTICNMLAKDIAVIIAIDKEKYEHQLNIILKEMGVFFLDKGNELINRFTPEDLKDIIYKRSEFVDSKIRYSNGKVLTKQEKIVAFKKLYKGINISQKSRSFINYPIGQYILEMYKIVNSGLTCDGFKKILYSNWYYNVGLESIKYDKFLNEFNYLIPYFSHISEPKEWVKELDTLATQKRETDGKPEYRFYPLKSVSEESISFFKAQLLDIGTTVEKLSKVFGDINEHLKALKDNFLLDDIITNQNISDEFEIEIIKHLKEIIDNINKSNLVTNIDSKYFSDNIKTMLMDYEREKAESTADNLTLNVVNLENMQKFKLTFFCMCEEDKYPRQYRVSFPFSENIVEILSNPKYDINCRPNFIKTLDYHMKLEKFLFLNVLDFTTEQMIITQTEEENGKELSNSIYIEDIFSMFGQDIKYTKLKDSQIRESENYSPITEIKMPYRDELPIKLSDICSYFVCPKLYYFLTNRDMLHEVSYDNEWKLNIYIPTLIAYKTIYNFGIMCKNGNKIYSLNNDELIKDLTNAFNKSFKEEIKLFDFASSYNKKDIKNKAQKIINQFVNKYVFSKGMLFVKFDLTNSETIKICVSKNKVYDVILDSCLVVINAQTNNAIKFDYSSQLDFLVKSAGGEYFLLEHFKDIMNRLNLKLSDDDRIALASSLFFKLNIQLNSPVYKQDEIVRLREVLSSIKEQKDSDYVPSSYCKYCKFESTCKMKERGV